MTSGNFGFLFNDNSKIIVSKDFYQFYYVRRQLKNGKNQFKAALHNFEEHPACVKPMLSEVSSLLNVLNENKLRPSIFNKQEQDESFRMNKNTIYLTKMKFDQRATCFKLSSNILQIIFKDSTEMVFCQTSGRVLVVTKNNLVLRAQITDNFHNYFSLAQCDPKLNQKLIYGKDVYQKYFPYSMKISTLDSKSRGYATNKSQRKLGIAQSGCKKRLSKDNSNGFIYKSHTRTNTQTYHTSRKNSDRNGSKRAMAAVNEIKKRLSIQFNEGSKNLQRRNHGFSINDQNSKSPSSQTYDNEKYKCR